MRMLSPDELKAREIKYAAIAAAVTDPELKRLAESDAAKARRSHELATRSVLDFLRPWSVPAEITAARVLAAVRVGEQAFLPVGGKLMRVLPNALARFDALFSLEPLPEDRKTIELNDTLDEYLQVYYKGEKLTRVDKLVYATVLDLYRDRPLGGAVAISFSDFIRRMYARETAMSISAGTLAMVRASLWRLWGATFRVLDTTPKATDGKLCRRALDVGLPRFFELKIDEAEHGKPSLRDTLTFVVAAQTAELFGPLAWSRVPHSTLMRQGLRGRVLSSYATHSKVYFVPMERLKAKCAYTSPLSDFRRDLNSVVAECQKGAGPDSEQIVQALFTADAEFQKQFPGFDGLDSVALIFKHFPCAADADAMKAEIEAALAVAKFEFDRDAGRRAAADTARARPRKRSLKEAPAAAPDAVPDSAPDVPAADDAIEGSCRRIAQELAEEDI